MNKKKYNEINHNEIYIQKYYVYYQIKHKNINDYSTIYKNFVDNFGENLKLTKLQFAKIKNKFNDEYKNLDLIQLIEKIKINIPELYIKIYDITYEFKLKNNIQNRDNRLIFFGIKKNLDLFSNEYTVEFFVDTTFKIIPVQLRPYKLFIITGITKTEKKPKLFTMIMTKYTDNITYSHIFDYLFINFGFKPKIIHSDYEASLSLAINENKNFSDDIIHVRCFFHFSQMVKRNLNKTGFFKKKLNPISIEIISNIELLCFINEEKINEFQKLILKKLNSFPKLKSFVKYLKNYLFKLSPTIYNYSKIIEHFKNNDNNYFINKLYTTNNICESLNSKISFNLPKKPTNNFNFVSALTNILTNEIIDENRKIYRKDYKTKCLLKIINDLDLNNEISWVSYDIIKKSLNEILNNNYEEKSVNDIENYIKYIIEEDDENIGYIEKSKDNNKNENINSESDDNDSEDRKEKENCFEDKNDNSIDIEEDNIDSKNINSDNDSVQDVDIINNGSDNYDKLINMFDDLDIKDDNNKSNYFKLPINERIKIRENKEMKNKANNKKGNKKKYNYPKN